MKNLVIVLKRSVLAGLLGSGIGLAGIGLGGAARAVTPDRPMPASALDESITATGSYLAGRHAQQTDDWPAAAEKSSQNTALQNDDEVFHDIPIQPRLSRSAVLAEE